MKKTVILLLAALLLPVGESLHAQRRSDYRTFDSRNVYGLRSVSHVPWTSDATESTYFDIFSDIIDNCYAPMHTVLYPSPGGDPNGTLGFYPAQGSSSVYTLKECMKFFYDRGTAAGFYQPVYIRFINCSFGVRVEAKNFNMLDKYLFSDIPALEQAEIGSGVRHLLKGTFQDSKNLKYVKFGKNVIKIDQDCFLGCSALEVVEFENSDVNSVPRLKNDIKYMFHTDFNRTALYCTNMKAFVVPDPLVSEYKTVLDDVFKPVKDGTCRVISKSEFYSPYVTGVIITTFPVILPLGSTYQLIASVLPSNAWNRNVTWSSDDLSVATVSSTGLMTAKSAGTVRITATSEENNVHKDVCTVIVELD